MKFTQYPRAMGKSLRANHEAQSLQAQQKSAYRMGYTEARNAQRNTKRVNSYFKGMANYHPLIPHVAGEVRFKWQRILMPDLRDPNRA